jgi:hypothetical protein
MGRHSRKAGRQSVVIRRAWTALLCLGAAAAAADLVTTRYRDARDSPQGVDFDYFLHAARNVAAGHSPYAGLKQYVYPPTIAVLLSPFSHSTAHGIWRAWIAIIVAAPLVAAVAFVASQAKQLASWLWPVLFALCAFTALYVHYWPVGRDLYLGQTDTVTLPLLVLSALAASRRAAGLRGVWLGLAALLKGWPAILGLSLLQRRLAGRRRSIATLVATAAVAPLLALAFGWEGGLIAFFKNAFDARQQRGLVNDSVWAAPQLMFTHSGLAQPVLVDASLRVAVTAALATLVVGLLLLTLRTVGEPVLCTFNVAFCVLLLLPVAHRQYSVFALPVLWYWAARQLRGGPFGARRAAELAVLGVLVLWWLVQCHAWPYTYSSASISAERYCVPFAADLLACAASVLGARLVRPAAEPTPTVDLAADQSEGVAECAITHEETLSGATAM